MVAKNEKIDGVLCLEASGGSGTTQVMRRRDLEGKFPIVAMDKSSETYDWISKGVISTTVIQKPYTMAFYGIRFLDDFHHNVVHDFKNWQTAPISPLPARVDTGTAAVTPKNLTEFQAAEASHRQQLQELGGPPSVQGLYNWHMFSRSAFDTRKANWHAVLDWVKEFVGHVKPKSPSLRMLKAKGSRRSVKRQSLGSQSLR